MCHAIEEVNKRTDIKNLVLFSTDISAMYPSLDVPKRRWLGSRPSCGRSQRITEEIRARHHDQVSAHCSVVSRKV